MVGEQLPSYRFLLMIASLFIAACVTHDSETPPDPPRTAAATFPVTTAVPPTLTRIATGEVDSMGEPVTIACATCHGLDQAQPELPSSAKDLGGPHAGLRFAHGKLPCAGCHEPGDASALHLADARKLPFTEAQQLCSQCHGPQARDYAHGAHGGMNGYWDLSRGPRTRNTCVSCHDPHAPAYPQFLPMPPPRDRFASAEAAHD